MLNRITHRWKRDIFLLLIVVTAGLSGCAKKEEVKELYHRFPNQTWSRFNILSFEMPVQDVSAPYDIWFFTRFSKEFQYDNLNFNMVLTTASGEERINEYVMPVKSASGGFSIDCGSDSCQGIILLKRAIKLNKPGILKIEIENLNPKINTEGVMGAGIRVKKSAKQP